MSLQEENFSSGKPEVTTSIAMKKMQEDFNAAAGKLAGLFKVRVNLGDERED